MTVGLCEAIRRNGDAPRRNTKNDRRFLAAVIFSIWYNIKDESCYSYRFNEGEP